MATDSSSQKCAGFANADLNFLGSSTLLKLVVTRIRFPMAHRVGNAVRQDAVEQPESFLRLSGEDHASARRVQVTDRFAILCKNVRFSGRRGSVLKRRSGHTGVFLGDTVWGWLRRTTRFPSRRNFQRCVLCRWFIVEQDPGFRVWENIDHARKPGRVLARKIAG